MAAIWRNVDRIGIGLVALIGISVATSSALADDGTNGLPTFGMTWDATNDPFDSNHYDPSDHATQETAFGTWQVEGVSYTGWRYVGQLISSDWTLTWDCIVNEDPFIVANIQVSNNTASTQTYSNYMNLSILPVLPGSIMSGSVSAALNNTNTPFSPDATLASAGAGLSIYQAFIDPSLPPPGGPPASEAVATLWNHPTSFTTPSATNQNASFAPVFGPAVLSELGLRLQFTLSAFDTASVTGIFQVEAIPGPAGLSAFAIFGLLSAGRRRRR